MMSENTQLTSATGYNTDRLVFSDPQTGNIPNSVPAITFRRINIQTKNPDGTIGDLIIPTTKLFSFGVSENTNPDSGKVNGYVMPICLWNKDSPTQEEKDWSTTFDKIVDKCKDHLIENKDSLEMYDLERNDLKKLNPLYWKREKGKIVEGSGPTLYAKLIVSKKHDKIVSMFYDFEGNNVNPLDLLQKYCYAKSAIKIESIFIGNKISLQVKLYECEVKVSESGMKRLLKRPEAQNRVLSSLSNPLDASGKIDDDEDDDGSLNGSDVDDEEKKVEKPKPVIKKKIVKKVVRKSS